MTIVHRFAGIRELHGLVDRKYHNSRECFKLYFRLQVGVEYAREDEVFNLLEGESVNHNFATPVFLLKSNVPFPLPYGPWIAAQCPPSMLRTLLKHA
jgi:hypothetical protein